MCTHTPRCNYPELRKYVASWKQCPVCEAKVGRACSVKKVEALAAKLAAVPEHITEVRYRKSDGEVTWAEAPNSAIESVDLTNEAAPALVADEGRRLFWLQQVTKVKEEA